jgi:hypothetical protein
MSLKVASSKDASSGQPWPSTPGGQQPGSSTDVNARALPRPLGNLTLDSKKP